MRERRTEEERNEEAEGKKKEKGRREEREKGASGKKNAGKQKGAKGHGRKVEIVVTEVKEHRAEECAGCGEKLGEEAEFKAQTGKYELEVEMGQPGLKVHHIKHVYGETK